MESLDDGDIRISTFDMTKGVRATFTPSSLERHGKYIINAQRLYQTLRVLPESEITFDINEKLNCTLSAGKAMFSMFATPGADFPTLPELITDSGFSIPSSTIKRMIGKVFHSIAVQDNRVCLTGALFNIEDNKIDVVSCDSFTFSKCSAVCDINSITASDVKYSFIIPGASLTELMKILPDDDDYKAEFYITRKHAIIKCDDVIFFTRTIDSEYIDYNRFVPQDNDIFIKVDREMLLSGLERANLIADEKTNGNGRSYVKVGIDHKYLSLSSNSVNGNVSDEMECEHTGDAIEIAFNCRYFINTVRVLDGDMIEISFKSPTKPIILRSVEKEENFDCFFMIVPTRMREA